MKKRLLIPILALMLLFLGTRSVPVWALSYTDEEIEAENTDGDSDYISNDGTLFTMKTVDPSGQRIYDFSDLFSDAEENELEVKRKALEEAKHCDIIVLTLSANEIPYDAYDGNDTTMKYAEQFYMDNGFADDGIIFTIDMNNRVLMTSGHGRYYSDRFESYTEDIYNAVLHDAKNGDYVGAVETFYRMVERYQNPAYAAKPTVLSILISIGLSVLIVIIFLSKHSAVQAMKWTPEGADAKRYKVLTHDVRFRGTRRIVRHIPPPPKSGGDGGSFSSSSGGGGFSGGGGGFSSGGGKF